MNTPTEIAAFHGYDNNISPLNMGEHPLVDIFEDSRLTSSTTYLLGVAYSDSEGNKTSPTMLPLNPPPESQVLLYCWYSGPANFPFLVKLYGLNRSTRKRTKEVTKLASHQPTCVYPLEGEIPTFIN
jgi:hypothetical protein